MRNIKEKLFLGFIFAIMFLVVFFLLFLLYSVLKGGVGSFVTYNLYLDPAQNVDLKLKVNKHNLEKLITNSIIYNERKEKYLTNIGEMISHENLYVFLVRYRNDNLEDILKQGKIPFRLSKQAYRHAKGYSHDGYGSLGKRVDSLISHGYIKKAFNSDFFLLTDSNNPQFAGLKTALVGTFYVMTIVIFFSFIFGVATAIYLEEFAKRNRFYEFIILNIENLASIPSIIYGLFGLAVLINFLELPRSSAVVGGIVLTFMVLPPIIIIGRSALRNVPQSIREASLSLGSTKFQTVLLHVLPFAMPSMFNGFILGVARALGETAPLLLLGMMSFLPKPSYSFSGPVNTITVQIMQWLDMPDQMFAEKASGAIMVLVLVLVFLNLIIHFLSNFFSKKRGD